MARWMMLALFCSILLPDALWARERTLSPYFVVRSDDPETDRLPLQSTAATVHISGVIAEVTVKQTYKNDGMRPIHARYVFPASTRAAVHGLTMTIGEHRIRAKIKEREEAKREFREAKKAGKSASLLEQNRPNVFTMNVANIMPGDLIEVELRYTELLVPNAGVYAFVYPTVVGPRFSEVPAERAPGTDRWLKSPHTTQGQKPLYTFDLKGTLTAGMPIDALTSPSHTIRADWTHPSSVEFSLDPTERDGGNRDFELHYRLDDGKIQSGLMLYEGQDENFFLLMVQPPRRVATGQIPPREYVFIVDVSGSMNGFPLETAKELLRNLIGDLRITDTFNVLFFAGGSRLWQPRSMPATQANIDDAIAMLDDQRGGGGTQLLAAIRRAVELAPEGVWSRNLIVVTDGYIAAEKEVFRYIRQHLGDANVFSFGIGTSVNRHLVEGIARAGMGQPFVVLHPDQAHETAKRFQSYVESPVLTGIGVDFNGFHAYEVEPESIPDVLADRPVIVHGKWRGRPTGRVVVTGISGDGDYEQRFEVAGVEPSPSNSALRYLWARSRISAISDFAFAGQTPDERRQLVELGLTYNLLTRHTSFIAVHEIVRNVGGSARNVNQPLPLPQGVSDLAVMGKGSEPELIWLIVLALLIGSLITIGRRA